MHYVNVAWDLVHQNLKICLSFIISILHI